MLFPEESRMLVTAENIREVMTRVPADQAEDLAPGCETWSMLLHGGSTRGQITVWPEVDIAAVSWGRGSFWGRWYAQERIILLNELIRGHAVVVDEHGEMWAYMEPAEFNRWMEERFVRTWDTEGLKRAAAGDAPEALTVSVGCSRVRIFRGEEMAEKLLSAMQNPDESPHQPKPNLH
jgi:hypothetical protein